MEVTSSNFKEILPKLEEDINRSTFLAIDCEFSGLNVVSEINAYDTPKQYYEKVRKNCKEFLVIQYGLSAFRFEPSDGEFKQQSYNFYIFRRPVNKNIPDQRFLCQTSSINFLTTQGFDFNKLFKSGISYLNITEESDYRDKLEEKQKLRNNQISSQQNSEVIPIPDDMQPMIDDILRQLGEFLDTDGVELELPKCNAFMRRLIYQTTAQKYKNKILLQTKQLKNKDRILVATKFKTKEEQQEIEKKLFEEELTVLDDFIGFTKVLRLIVDSGKLVVGHNMCLDFFHTIDKFLTPLPVDYEEFKECAHSLFKNILDTKFMASSEDFKDLIPSTILKDLIETTSKTPFQLPPIAIEDEGQGYSVEDKKEHEAGYDAYITGVCFLSMWSYLGKLNEISLEDTFKDLHLLEPFVNKLFLMMLRDNQYIHLGSQDPNPPRDHVFYLTFPRDWKLNNIIELFSPFGSVYVAWINETSAYVGLYKREQAAVALSTLSQSDTYSIMTYSRRQSQLSGIKTPLASPAPTNRKKRYVENTTRGGMSKKFEPILEDESEAGSTPKNTRKGSAKIFSESDAWD
ncbi:poly(A)-specific ribonuclease PARN [Asbolus verrucosus]|uniref:Poly(A)-specific ribonuclease PARN n=1 Tax=Asbolus verrucosus TaxID=1661398 RepID=A0A482V6C9_ASBVE|nr:poly(A)-specific ribonuclease PARN [Asbolus verrucosus]